MVNLVAPAAVIFCNNEISDGTKSTIQSQLFVNETITGIEFDARIAADPNYINEIHGNGLKILVLRSLDETTNRHLADIVLLIRNGLASVMVNKFGPPGQTYATNRMYLSQLFHTS